jgi:hypothetical protein
MEIKFWQGFPPCSPGHLLPQTKCAGVLRYTLDPRSLRKLNNYLAKNNNSQRPLQTGFEVKK